MQVAVLTEQLYAPVPGGTARYTRDLLASLAAASPPDGGVARWAARHRGPGPVADDDQAVGGYPADWPAQRHLPLDRRALSLAWAWRLGPTPTGAQAVHAPTLLVPPGREAPLFVTVHDDVPWTHPGTLTRYGVWWHRRMGRRIGQDAALVVTPTAAVASRLLQVLPGLTADRLLAIPNPLTRHRIRQLATPLPDERERMVELRLPERGYLLFVGTREPRKGLDVLLTALAQPGGPRLPLLVVGPTGWGRVDLDGAEGRVRPMGRVDDDELGVIYRHATALVLPSRAEGFGYPVAEAMCAGTPVVTSDDPALLETGAGAALTVPVADAPALARALRRVEDDAALRQDLADQGRERARSFGELAYGRTMWELYSAG